MKHRIFCLSITLTLGLGLVLTLLWLGCAPAPPVLAQSGTGIIRVSNTHPNSLDTPGCGSQSIPCLTIQYAVDQALPGEEIHVAAGIYTQVNHYGGQHQVVAISKTLTLRGGYTTTTLAGGLAGSDWLPPDADANPTILDAQEQGRVLYISGDVTVTVEGLHLTGGDNTPEFYPLPASPGAGAYVLSATATFSHCDVYDNTTNRGAYGSGGGIYAESATLTVNRCEIHDNTAGHGGPSWSSSRGGGLHLWHGSAILTDNRIHHNRGSAAVAGYGGGLYALEVTSLTLTNNEVLSNTAVSTASIGGLGGGVSLSASSATLVSNTIRGNHACKAHYAGLNLSIDCRGGGISLYGCDPCILSDNQVESNIASSTSKGQGGGLRIWGGEVELLRNNLLHNSATMSTTAEGLGGGLYASGEVTLTMINNMVTANQANSQGSGLWVGGNGGQAQGLLLHNTIADNGTPGSGAPVSTIGRIMAASGGHGVYAAPGSTLALSNTILSGHPDAAIFVSDTSTVTLEATLWFTNNADTAGPGAITRGTVDITGDPAYAEPAGNDYHLTRFSAAIDAGIDAGIDDDFDGQPRPAGTGYDMGADELPVAPHSAYLPLVFRDN